MLKRMMRMGMWGGGAAAKPIFNVVTGYGAVGDGTTNDTTAVQNTLNAAGAAKGICYFPAGNYSCAHLTFPANVTVQGPTTTGTPRPTTWTAELISRTGYSDNFVNIMGANVTVKYLSFNGNRATCTSNGLLYGQTNVGNVMIDSCYLHNSLIEGIEDNGSPNWTIQNCTFDDNDYGVMLLGAGTENCLVQNNKFTNTRHATNGSMNAATSANNNTFLNNTVDNTSGSIKKGVNISASSSVTVKGNTFINPLSGVVVQTSGANNNVIDGNTFTAGAYSTGNAIGVVSDAGTGTQIINNTITGWSAGYSISTSTAVSKINGNTVTNSAIVRTETTSTVAEVKNNVITGSTTFGMQLRADTTGMVIDGNTISMCSQSGIQIYGTMTNMVMQNNVCFNNGQRKTNNDAGILMPYANSGLSIINNHCYDDQGTKSQKWGISVANGSTGTYTANNDMTGNISAPVWDGLTAV